MSDPTIVQEIGMTFEQAEDILHSVVSNRIRWGKLYDGKDIGFKKLCDALVVIAHAENKEATALRTTLTLSNRQLAASTAREGKLKKRIAELTGKPVEDGDVE